MTNLNVTLNRHKYVGGSDLPNILGFNTKYGKSIFDFAKEKAGIVPNTFNGNEYTRYGQLMEPIIRDYINAVNQCNYKEDSKIDIQRSYRGNTDGLDPNTDIPILEVKTFGNELDVDYYTPQCQFYMEVFNQDKCRLVGYQRPNDFYTGVDYSLEHDDHYFNIDFDKTRLQEHIIERDKTMWEHIENRINVFLSALEILRVNPDMSENDFNTMIYGNQVMVLANKLNIVEQRLTEYKEIEKEYKQLTNDLYKLFDEKNILSLDTGAIKITKVSPTSYNRTSIDTDKLKQDNPNIYNKYKVVKTVNRKGYVLISRKEDTQND